MFRICVVGCGNMSKGGHGPSFRKYKADYSDVCLAACCDLDAQKARSYAEVFGFERWYTDYPAMLEAEQPDAVSLICPVSLTKSLSIDIMRRGYSVILEKPPGLNIEELSEMRAAAAETGVFVRTAFNRRYIPLMVKLKELLADKRIYNITYQMYRTARRDLDFATTAIHAIDAVKHIAGADYKEIDFLYQELPEEGQNVANYLLNGTMENGTAVQLALIPLGGTVMERMTVNTPDETYFLELPIWGCLDFPGRLRMIRKKQIIVDICGSDLVDSDEMFESSGFYEENRSFFELIRSGAAPSCDLESGVQSVEIANALRNRAKRYQK